MDIISILEQLKKKGLDVVQIELLKNAYELQNRNLDQLKENNDALRESNDLLKEKIQKLEKEKLELAAQLKALPPVKLQTEVSALAIEVLKQCIKADTTKFNSENMISTMSGSSRVQVETAIGELSKKGYLVQASVSMGYGRGVEYRLTQPGKEFAVALAP